ncbi:MAG: plastocyanin [Lactobacillus sp.]|nr:plastocyanin [Lactobacillus sp.]
MWLDVSEISQNSQELADYIRRETGLIVSPGSIYRGNGKTFLRLNLASPISMIKDGINRLITGIKKYSKK